MRKDEPHLFKLEAMTVRLVTALTQLKVLRAATVDHASACYRRGQADALRKPMAAAVEQQAVRLANDRVSELFAELAKTLTTDPPNTPAEARTGISDRNAAALADVAELRHELNRVLDYTGTDVIGALDRIEQALRGGGA